MTGFTQQFIASLKEKIRLSDFIKSAVTWDKKKSSPARQDWWAPCPFHHEKSASFHVDDRKGFYHCFGCGAHGSIIDWLMTYQRYSFLDTMKHLCEITHTPLPEFSKQDAQKSEARKSLYQLMADVQDYYMQQISLPKHKHALDYIIYQRGLNMDHVHKYGIGYAPNSRFSLLEYLQQKGYSSEDCIQSGMIIQPENSNDKPYDRFRNRVMFPVKNAQGKIITYGGRALNPEARAKYLNGSETDIFKKSSVLYNIDKISHQRGAIQHFIVCEGYMDVIALGMHGFNNCVAPMGTALTEEQIKLIWRYHHTPILCFDGDKAGMDAACRAAHRVLDILTAGYSLKFCFLPSGLDPDDFLKQKGKDAFAALLDKALPLSAVLFAKAAEECPPTTPEMQAGLEKELLALSRKIPDERLCKLYQSDLFKRLNKFIYDTSDSRPKKHYRKSSYVYGQNYQHSEAVEEFQKSQNQAPIESLEHIELMILGFFIRFGGYLSAQEFDILAKMTFDDSTRTLLQKAILNIFFQQQLKKLEKVENMPSISSIVIDSQEDSTWQLPSDIRQSEVFRRALVATESIKMTLSLPFINHTDRINYLGDMLHNGLCNMYNKILSKKQIDRSLHELSNSSGLEGKSYEKFLELNRIK